MSCYKSGIYMIKCQSTNKLYIGKSVNVYRRLNQHKRELKQNKHPNKFLQKEYNKYSKEFIFKVLFYCPEDDLSFYEAKMLHEAITSGFEVYNIIKNPFRDLFRKQTEKLEFYQEWGINPDDDPKLKLVKSIY